MAGRSANESSTSIRITNTILRKQSGLQAGLHFGPLGVQDAEVNRMPEAASGRDHVIPERAFLTRADAEDCRARAFVERIRFQLDANAAELLEGVLQQQVFCFRVDGRSLPRGRDPRPAYLHPMVGSVDVAVARAADRLAAGFFDQRKRQGNTSSLF